MLPSDYVNPDSEYSFLNKIKPHLFFSKQQGDETINYLLENFEPTLPRYQLRKRIKDYVDYIATWDEDNEETPIVLFICSNIADLLYVKRRVKKLLDEEWSDEVLCIRVTTSDKVRASGVASLIWEEVS
ncbi:MAG TPA: hypothetical protein VMY99_02800 [Nevskiaceae bacterium]|nr:hypothetical protein [Nevskiaceae bacterium]